MSNASGLLGRESYAGIALYAPDRRPCAIDLSDNTNLWGAPPSAVRALHDTASASMTRYPELYAGSLKDALADYIGVRRDQIVTGCGSDDVLDSAIRAFAEPGDRVAVPDPSFAMIPIFARMNSLESVLVPLTSHYDVDVERTLQAEARVTYLCSPNNPTGTPLSRRSIEDIVESTSGLIIVDEAYAEFAGCSVTDLLERSDRLLITRTMSKAFGLAGLRVGYAIGAPKLIREVEKSRGPYKVNAIAERAAVSAVRNDMAWVRANVDAANANRTRLLDSLRDLGLDPLPSSANFVLAP
ncbi:MAG TPA: aminotransferase class I/II-fold pyridoxal phosphate-dependent enzyme, partial [Gemmatimonadaceae bacterium]|nr:aminotransferase class I/II-fold pyridoxal phosphate-dependent enzyme [Gemmatimonadaceae bacterium]